MLSRRYKNRLQNVQWVEVWQSFAEDFPAVCVIVDLILSLPAASAENERGFSRMKRTKTESRTRLSAQSLTDLMMIDMSSPEIEEFDPEPAIIGWLEAGKRRRRPNIMDKTGPAFKSRRVEVETNKAAENRTPEEAVEVVEASRDSDGDDDDDDRSDAEDDEGLYLSDEDDNEMEEDEIMKRLEEIDD